MEASCPAGRSKGSLAIDHQGPSPFGGGPSPYYGAVCSAPSGSAHCSAFASSHGARIQAQAPVWGSSISGRWPRLDITGKTSSGQVS